MGALFFNRVLTKILRPNQLDACLTFPYNTHNIITLLPTANLTSGGMQMLLHPDE